MLFYGSETKSMEQFEMSGKIGNICALCLKKRRRPAQCAKMLSLSSPDIGPNPAKPEPKSPHELTKTLFVPVDRLRVDKNLPIWCEMYPIGAEACQLRILPCARPT